MAIPTLSGSYIDETYIRLVQVSGSEFADGLGNPISFGNGSLSGGINGYIPIWSGSTALSNSFLNQSNDILKTTSGSSDIGLKLDFANKDYRFGDYLNSFSGSRLMIFDTTGEIVLAGNNTSQGFYVAENAVGRKTIMGDWDNAYNSTKIIVDDTNQIVQITGSLSIASEFTLDEALTKFAKYTNVGVGVANDITLFSIPTGSYTSAFGKYTIYSGSNSRAGELMISRNDTIVNSTDVATNDIGSTTVVRLSSQVSQSYYQIIASFPATGTWDIKMMATYI